MKPFWTQQEEDILQRLYLLETKQEIFEQLPGRTWLGITQHARKMGIVRHRIRQSSRLKLVYGEYFAWHLRADGYIQIAGKGIGPPKYKEYEHRYVWKIFNGEIPKNYEVHHLDGDRTNNVIENLELIHRSQHHARDREVRLSMTNFLKKKRLYSEWRQGEKKRR